MAQIHGQVESLKRLLSELNSRGINRFNSIQDIQAFVDNFQNERDQIVLYHEQQLEREVEDLEVFIKENKAISDRIKKDAKCDFDHRINNLKLLIAITNNKVNSRFKKNILSRIKLWFLQRKLESLIEDYPKLIQLSADKIDKQIECDSNKLFDFKENPQEVLNERCRPDLNQLNYIKEVLQDFNTLILGAKGEIQVVKEIEKLSDDFVLINDFSVHFNPPLYRRSSNDRIYSIQIDHLLISKVGIFILETKNWSKKSIESLDLRSPVDQIRRSSYALFRLISNAIDGGEIRLNHHHWGDKNIQVRNIIVMINEKPKEEFQFVKIKTLSELNSYISFFEDILSEDEVRRLTNYFIAI
jgi:hypothetical protein